MTSLPTHFESAACALLGAPKTESPWVETHLEGAPQVGPLGWGTGSRRFGTAAPYAAEERGGPRTEQGHLLPRGFMSPQRYLGQLLVLNICYKQMRATQSHLLGIVRTIAIIFYLSVQKVFIKSSCEPSSALVTGEIGVNKSDDVWV